MVEDNISEFISKGKEICSSNSFYNTLALVIKYYFLSDRSDVNLMDLMRDVSKSEMEFKTFMVYKNFAIDLYYSHVEKVLTEHSDSQLSYDNIINIIIYFVKNKYDENHNVLSTYITGMNHEEMIDKFNFIKTTYELKKEELSKVTKLFDAIKLLEEANAYEKKAKNYRDKALKILYDVHKTSKLLLNSENSTNTNLILNKI